MSNKHRKLNRSRNGAAIIELAFAAPVFFLFLFAGLEFGRMIMIQHTADNAAYEAARIAMVPGATSEEATEKAEQVMALVGANMINVSVNPEVITADTKELSVTVSVPIADNSWMVPKFVSQDAIEATSRLATERYNND